MIVKDFSAAPNIRRRIEIGGVSSTKKPLVEYCNNSQGNDKISGCSVVMVNKRFGTLFSLNFLKRLRAAGLEKTLLNNDLPKTDNCLTIFSAVSKSVSALY